jgi:hypothetical protein
MMWWYVVYIIIIIFIVHNTLNTNREIVATDGISYMVHGGYVDYKNAGETLAHLNDVNKKVIDRMRVKYKNSDKIDILFLEANYDETVIEENVASVTGNTSYVVNKGDLIKLCLREAQSGKIHDINTLVFVSLHELSHMVDKNWGHTKTFWAIFQDVLETAVELDLYMPVDYRKYPIMYCGMEIRSNPYFLKRIR